MCRRSRKKLLDGRSYAETLCWPPNSFTEGDLSFVAQRDLRGQEQVKAVGRSEKPEGEYQCCRHKTAPLLEIGLTDLSKFWGRLSPNPPLMVPTALSLTTVTTSFQPFCLFLSFRHKIIKFFQHSDSKVN